VIVNDQDIANMTAVGDDMFVLCNVFNDQYIKIL
jgi:hypothetical protein